MQTHREIKKGSIWKHYKGNTYKVLAIAIHENTKKELVVYQETECSQSSKTCKTWVRSKENFLEILNSDERVFFYRFKEIN